MPTHAASGSKMSGISSTMSTTLQRTHGARATAPLMGKPCRFAEATPDVAPAGAKADCCAWQASTTFPLITLHLRLRRRSNSPLNPSRIPLGGNTPLSLSNIQPTKPESPRHLPITTCSTPSSTTALPPSSLCRLDSNLSLNRQRKQHTEEKRGQGLRRTSAGFFRATETTG